MFKCLPIRKSLNKHDLKGWPRAGQGLAKGWPRAGQGAQGAQDSQGILAYEQTFY